ncbi:hypothetical protein [Acetobacter persici]|uniref:Uncharacterized protein n=1 Tax=Acetobacter persici TaxID=1076596 RepID=A0A1U9LJI4_9PROT|nr:hypothetical protein [Acetobacter persici]AQT06558.1 hypothetical protein A0U91_16250 [Acetobacter persici]
MAAKAKKTYFFVQWVSPEKLGKSAGFMFSTPATFDSSLEDAEERFKFAASKNLVPVDGFIYEVAHQRGLKVTPPGEIGKVDNNVIETLLSEATAHLPRTELPRHEGEKHTITSKPATGLLFYVDIETPQASIEHDIVVVPSKVMEQDGAFNVYDILCNLLRALPDCAKIRDDKAYEVLITSPEVETRSTWKREDNNQTPYASIKEMVVNPFNRTAYYENLDKYVALTGKSFDMHPTGRFLAYQDRVAALRKNAA